MPYTIGMESYAFVLVMQLCKFRDDAKLRIRDENSGHDKNHIRNS